MHSKCSKCNVEGATFINHKKGPRVLRGPGERPASQPASEYIKELAEGLAKRSPSSMLCNTTSSLIVRGAESAVHCGEAAPRGLAPCTALRAA